MKSYIAIFSVIACFAVASALSAAPVLVVHTATGPVPGQIEFHVGSTPSYPSAGDVLLATDQAGSSIGYQSASDDGAFTGTGFTMESPGGGLNAGMNVLTIVMPIGSTVFGKTETNYDEGSITGANIADGTAIIVSGNDLTGQPGPSYNHTLDTRDLRVPLAGFGFANVMYLGIIPEPGSLMMLALGCLGIVLAARRNRR